MMRRLIFMLLCALPLSATVPSFVQAQGAIDTNTDGTMSLSYGTNTTAGNGLIVVASTVGGSLMTIADDAGDTFVTNSNCTLSPTSGHGNWGTVQMWWVLSAVGGSRPTVTLTKSINSTSFLLILEYSGQDTTTFIDTGSAECSIGTAASGGTYTTGSITTSAADDLLFAVLFTGAGFGQPGVPPTNWSGRASTPGRYAMPFDLACPGAPTMGDCFSSLSIGTYSATITDTDHEDAQAFIAAFKSVPSNSRLRGQVIQSQ